MIKRIALIIFLLLVISNDCRPTIIDSKKQHLFTLHKHSIPACHLDTTMTCSRFNHQKHATLSHIVDNVMQHFIEHHSSYHNNQIDKKPLVILDIDDTALTPQEQRQSKKQRMAFLNHTIVPPIFKLYTFFRNRQYHIAFVTARIEKDDTRKRTLQHLHENGYLHFDSLHMRPSSWQGTIGQWKEQIRKELAEKYTIVCTCDDKWQNLQGSHTGDCLVLVGGVRT